MLQYESVLTRPEHLEAAQISAADVEVLLNAIALVMEPIRISYLWRPIAGIDRFGIEVMRPTDAVRRLENRS